LPNLTGLYEVTLALILVITAARSSDGFKRFNSTTALSDY
jgi:hypothetical protein